MVFSYRGFVRGLWGWLISLAVLLFAGQQVRAQSSQLSPCRQAGLGTPSTFGGPQSQKNVCAPARHEINYRLRYRRQPPATHKYEIVFEWGDGKKDVRSVTANQISGSSAHEEIVEHAYPDADAAICNYVARVQLFIDDKACPETLSSYDLPSWSTDNRRGGKVQMSAPNIAANDNIFLRICEGEDINIPLTDFTTLNCQSGTQPNDDQRNYQVVYNTGTGNTIPNVSVGGTLVTNAQGDATQTGEYSPDGVITVSSPVNNAYARATIKTITAQGGFGPGFPKSGDSFQVKLRYWNICNEYKAATGASNAITATATIEIVGAPNPPLLRDTLFCTGNNYSTYIIRASSPNTINPVYKWHNTQGNLLRSGSGQFGSNFNPLSYFSNLSSTYYTTGGEVKVLATVNASASGNAVTCQSDTTEVTFAIRPALDGGRIYIGNNPAVTSLTICSGQDPNAFTANAATGGDGTYSYSWERATNGFSYSAISGATNQNFDPGSLTATTWYRRKVTSTPNAKGSSTLCKEAYSNVFRVDVQQPVTAGAVGGGHTVCLGGDAPTVLGNITGPTGGNGGYTYQWESSTVDPSSPSFTNANVNVEANTNLVSFRPPANLGITTWYRRAVRSGVCSDAAADPWERTAWVKVEVNSTLNGGTIAFSTGGTPQNICSGATPSPVTQQTSPSGGSTYTYQWRQAGTPGGPYTLIQGATDQNSYTPPSLTDTTYYVRTTTSGVCSVNSNEAAVNVSPLPTMTISGGGSICGTSSPSPDVEIQVTGGVAPWVLSYNGPAGSVDVNPLGTAGDASAKHVINNPAAGNYRINSVRDAANCNAPSVSTVVVVNNAASSLSSVTSVTSTGAVCHAAGSTNPPDAVLTFSPIGASNYRVKYAVGGVDQPDYIGSSSANGKLQLSPSYALWGYMPGTRILKIKEVASFSTGCRITLPSADSVLLKVDSVPVVNPNQTKIICSSQSVNYKIEMSGAPVSATTFSWTRSGVTENKGATEALHITDVLVNKTNNSTIELYSVTPATASCTGTAQLVRIFVNPEPVITPGQSVSVCGSQSLNHSIQMSNTPLNSQITWTNPRSGVNTTVNLQNTPVIVDILANTSSTKDNQVLYYKLVAQSGSGCEGQKDSLEVTLFPVPEIASANTVKNICKEEPANYSISLEPAGKPTGVTFSWNNPISGNPVSVLAGAPNTFHIRDSYSTSGTRNYVVTAISADTCRSTPKTITINVNQHPNVSNISLFVCEEIATGQSQGLGKGSIDLTTLATQVGKGAADTIKWYKDYNTTTRTLSGRITDGSVAGQTRKYEINSDQTIYAEISSSSGAGCSSVATVTLRYQPAPPTSSILYSGTGIRDSNGYNICMDATITHTFQVPQSPAQTSYPRNATYRWKFPSSQAQLASGSDTTTSSIRLIFPVRTPVSGEILSVTEYHNGCPGVTQLDTINTETTASKSSITGPDIVCTGNTNQSYSVSGASQGSTLYTWSLPSGVSFVTNTLTRGNKIFVDFTGDARLKGKDTLTIAVQVQTGLAKCVAEAADPVRVIRVQTPVMSSSTAATICSGKTAASGLVLSATGGPTVIKYNWAITTVQGTLGGATVGATGFASDSLGSSTPLTNQSGLSSSATYNVTPVGPNKVNGGNSCVGAGQVVTITVNPEPVIVSSQRKTVCSGDAVNYEILLRPLNLPKKTRFNWPAIPPDAQAGSNVLSGDNPGTIHIKDVIENKTTAGKVYTYKITPDDGNNPSSCLGAMQDVLIAVNPEPVGRDTTIKICSGVKLNYSLQSNLDAVVTAGVGLPSSFEWHALDNPNISGETLLKTNGSGASIGGTLNDRLVNTTNTSQNVIYRVTPKNKLSSSANVPECSGDIFTVIVTVQPEPVGKTDNTAICSGLSLSYDLNANVTSATTGGLRTGITYIWLPSSNTNITRVVGGTVAGTITDTLRNFTISDQAMVYTVIPTYTDASGSTCDGESFNINLIVHPEPRGAADSKTICSKNNVDINLQNIINAKGNKLTSNFSWVGVVATNCPQPSCGVTGFTNTPSKDRVISDLLVNTSGASVDVNYTVTPSSQDQSCAGTPFVVTVKVNPEPVATTTADTLICSSTNFNYDLQSLNINKAPGNGVASTFTWKATANPSVTGEPTITQASGVIALLLQNKTTSQSRVLFTVTPTSVTGSCVGSSFEVGVLVNPEPVGFSDQITVCGGTPLNYDLQAKNINNSGSGGNSLPSDFTWIATQNTNVSGESTVSKTTSIIQDNITNVTPSLQNVTYTISPKSKTGGCKGNDFQLLVAVNQSPQSSSTTHSICSGSTFTRNLVANITNSAPSTFAWSAASNPNVSGETIINQSSINISDALSNTSGTDQAIVYTVLPTTTSLCTGKGFTVTVTVHPEPVGTLDTVSICSDASLGYDLQANVNRKGNVPSQFRWKSRTSVANVRGESTVEQSTNTIRDNLNNVTTSTGQVIYDVMPSSVSDNCEGAQFTIMVNVYPEPTANDATGLNLCSGDRFSYDLKNHLQQSGNGLTANTSYTWLAQNGANVTGESLTDQNRPIMDDVLLLGNNIIANQQINYTVTPLDGQNNCSGDPFAVQVIVKPKPIGLNESLALCSDTPLSFKLADNIAKGNNFINNTTYTWFTNANGNVNGETTTPKRGDQINDRLVNITNVPQSMIYNYIPQNSNGCTGDTVRVTLTVNPSPILNPALATKSICSRSVGNPNPVGITLGVISTSIPASGYNITSPVQSIPGFTGTPTVGSNLTANAISSDAYNNITTSTVDVTYTVVPVSSGACLGTSLDIVVRVYPEPVVNPNLNTSVCSGVQGGIVLSTDGTSVAADSYTLQKVDVPSATGFTSVATNTVSGANGSASLIERDTFTNLTSSDAQVRYEIRAKSALTSGQGGCISEPQTIVLTVKPEPVLDTTTPGVVCSGVASGITLKSTANSVGSSKYNIIGKQRANTVLTEGTNNAVISFNQPADVLSNDIFYNTTSAPLTVTYNIVPISAENCIGKQGDLVLTINPAPAIASNLNKMICSGAVSGIVLNTLPGGITASSYEIVSIDVPTTLTASATNATLGSGLPNDAIRSDKFDNLSNDPLKVTYKIRGSSAVQCIGNVSDVVLTIEPVIVTQPVINARTICSDANTDIILKSPTNPSSGKVTFDYTVSVPSTGTSITGFVASQSNLPEDFKLSSTLVNTGNSVNNITYNVTAVANGAQNGAGCSAPQPLAITLNVEPRPKVEVSIPKQFVCEGSPINVRLTSPTKPSTGSGIDFESSVVPAGGMTLASPSSPTPVYAQGASIVDAWSNPTLDNHNVVYTLISRMTGGLKCKGKARDVVVTIKPNPELTPVTLNSVCSGKSLAIPLTFDLPNSYATWVPSAPAAIMGASSGGGTSIDLSPINTSLSPQVITYAVTPRLGECLGPKLNVQVQVNPSPNVVGLPNNITVCNGQTLNVPLSSAVPGATTFKWTVQDAYGLGTPGKFNGSGTTINEKLDNLFGYQVVLVYDVVPTSSFSCVGSTAFMNVEVTSIVPKITPNKTKLCSGENISVVNTSRGATAHKWFYRLKGAIAELGKRTEPSVSYRLENNTSSNPIYYEIVYEASNGVCSKPNIATPAIAVYRSVKAGFDEGTVPPLTGGVSQVNFTNTSKPIEATQFRYEWDFGVESQPTKHTGSVPPSVVTYNTRGSRDVTLKAINNAAETDGLACEDTFVKTILVPIVPLKADFTIDQSTVCVPLTVSIKNSSTGDVNEWRVLKSGTEILSSNENNPVFNITSSGEYTIYLTTRDPFTGQNAVLNKTFRAYEKPKALFSARPTTVFIPDTELVITNSSERANMYAWDFGDGTTSKEQKPPNHVYKIEGKYVLQLIASYDYGNGAVCRDSIEQIITARSGGELKIPNSFTPNNAFSSTGGTGGGPGTTGVNDMFLPIVKGVRSFNMQVYDRWGNLIFESQDAKIGWDGRSQRNGKLLPAGVYIYRLEVQLSDGKVRTKVGDITMIR